MIQSAQLFGHYQYDQTVGKNYLKDLDFTQVP